MNSVVAMKYPAQWISCVKKLGKFVLIASLPIVIWYLWREVQTKFTVEDLKAGLSGISTHRVLIAAIFAALNYLIFALYDVIALRHVGSKIPYLRVLGPAFIASSFSQTLGFSLFSGGAVRYRFYSAMGVGGAKIAELTLFIALHFWLGLLVVCAIASCFSAIVGGRLSDGLISASALIPICLYLTLCCRSRSISLKYISLRCPTFRTAAAGVFVGALDWVLAALVLFSLVRLPSDAGVVTYAGIVSSFFLAQFAGVVSNSPGGLGVFDGTFLILLAPYSSPASVIGGLVLYRAVYYAAPFVVAALLFAFYEFRALFTGPLSAALPIFRAVTPAILSGSVFLCGVVLLLSGATPTSPERAWIGEVVSLQVMESAHFVNSITGTVLLFVSYNLSSRIRRAYYLALALLLLGIFVSLLKGFDYEEAILLGSIFFSLLCSRRYFYRKGRAIRSFSARSWTGLAFVIVAIAWLCFFSYKHVDYADTLWWEFAIDSDAPRSLRGLLASVLALLIVGLRSLILPKSGTHSSVTERELLELMPVVASRHSTDINLLYLRDKSLFINDDRSSFIMYQVSGRSWIALGDPVGDSASFANLAWRFREECDRHNAHCVFYEVSDSHLPLYLDIGLTLYKLGEEAIVDLTNFSLAGNRYKSLRQAVKRLERDGYSFSVSDPKDVESLLPQLKVISDRWLEAKRCKEKGFSLGFFDEAYLRRFPIALVKKEGEILGFANIWHTESRKELSVDLMRYLPSSPNGIMDLLFVNLMLWGQEHGYSTFNLGMAPLSGLQSRSFAPFWHRMGAYLYKHGENFYNFEGLRRYKDKFSPVWRPRYLATSATLSLPFVLANVTRLISGAPRIASAPMTSHDVAV